MSVNKPGIVELSKKVDCRYTLVVETSKRARQLGSRRSAPDRSQGYEARQHRH